MNRKREMLTGLDLRSIPPGSALAIQVADTGQGIDHERLEAIFDRFEQANTAEQCTPSGLGLGLFISRQLVLLHGGEIWAEAPRDGGSRFTFTLPLLSREEIFRAALADRLQTAKLHQYSTSLILVELAAPDVAEDDESISISLEPEQSPLAGLIRGVLRRKSDTVLWRGGNRFAITLPQTEALDAQAVVRRIIDALSTLEGDAARTTLRIGIAAFPEDGDTAETIIGKAEERRS